MRQIFALFCDEVWYFMSHRWPKMWQFSKKLLIKDLSLHPLGIELTTRVNPHKI